MSEHEISDDRLALLEEQTRPGSGRIAFVTSDEVRVLVEAEIARRRARDAVVDALFGDDEPEGSPAKVPEDVRKRFIEKSLEAYKRLTQEQIDKLREELRPWDEAAADGLDAEPCEAKPEAEKPEWRADFDLLSKLIRDLCGRVDVLEMRVAVYR